MTLTIRRHALLAAGSLAGLGALVAAPWPGEPIRDALWQLGDASAWTALAAIPFALQLVMLGLAWRCALGARFGAAQCVSRYAAGSLANALLPMHAGSAVRVGLFARLAGLWPACAAGAGVSAARAVAVGLIGAGAVARGVLPLKALALLGAAVLVGVAAAVVARRRGGLTLTPAVFAWAGAAVAVRIGAVAAVAAAFGIDSPLTAALLVVPALELASTVQVTPGNVGLAAAASAFALQAHGVAGTDALAAGIALHAVETATSIAAGGIAVAWLALRR